ncbi:MAG: hypothetical protein P1P85_00945 [Patescibacteria group bacterium]|nr:hypothetical protein [Patescibacteria group bacterium]
MEKVKRKICLLIVLEIFLLISVISVAQAVVPLTVDVRCNGGECVINKIPNGFVFYADPDSDLTLTPFVEGGIGNKRYRWEKDNRVVLDSRFLQTVVTKEEEYLLTVTDDGGSIERIIKIFPRSKRDCTITLSPIKLNDKVSVREEIREYAIGDTFSLIIPYTTTGECDIKIKWDTKDSGIIIKSPNSKTTEIEIGSSAKTEKKIIKATISDGSKSKEKEINITVVRNSPPSFKLDFDYPESNSDFEVYLEELKTGSNSNENNDFIQSYYAELKNNNNVLISRVSWTRRSYEEKIPIIRMKTKGMGSHNLTVTITDSHGAGSTLTKDVEVFEGSNKKTPLVMNSLPNRIDCKTGEECKINAWKVFDRYNRQASLRFYDKTNKKTPLTNLKGGYCESPTCIHIFEYQGTYIVGVEAGYLNRKGFKEITVVVTDNETKSDIAPKQILTPTSTRTPIPYQKITSTPETPGMEIWMAIIMIIVAIVFQRRKK